MYVKEVEWAFSPLSWLNSQTPSYWKLWPLRSYIMLKINQSQHLKGHVIILAKQFTSISTLRLLFMVTGLFDQVSGYQLTGLKLADSSINVLHSIKTTN